ncbi:MAG: cytochrome-c oxidase, cbb3-type subunit III [Gammaproteobacteria bacterium]|jgi:cytochrome c oxidase cbb3-type subunit 3|nr:cytochrome-c oxidase, cbb3-type subunit III [Gammaproteobacteria bacterium]MBP6053277.1 cytochrome-c oxidase, cbb3-type subunit III [Pseudomonadales bacterium]MBK6584115.1 cytochrome-c oxidase, cbb3-type subunit III [Gammaproteobacteria bacterium]MBK7168635.1 cytochrome-c oxidase, cbb3-type subunit III [Gammaproteobacteria bacterium]MBK7520299.1 cytochrome-c oxidase, cbb3-type subunit III [Gammaproteobacteria bacterium]
MSSFWSAYIVILTIFTIVATGWLLFANRTRPADSEAKTGHVYDGIEEYDHPLPAWWFHMFVITIVFAIGYLIAYPGLGNFRGLLDWTQIDQWQNEVEAAKVRYEPVFAGYRDLPVEELAKTPAAVRMGQRIFAVNCAQCHGADGRGSRGFPNLADGDWIWGGSVDAIHTTIEKGRQAVMPPWVAVLGEDGVNNVAHYVLTLSGTLPAGAESAAGETQFKTICASCHGPEGNGNPLLGAPRLNDTTWLYGNELEQIKHTLRAGRNGKMPAFGEQLGSDKIHLLTAYVYSLSAP